MAHEETYHEEKRRHDYLLDPFNCPLTIFFHTLYPSSIITPNLNARSRLV